MCATMNEPLRNLLVRKRAALSGHTLCAENLLAASSTLLHSNKPCPGDSAFGKKAGVRNTATAEKSISCHVSISVH